MGVASTAIPELVIYGNQDSMNSHNFMDISKYVEQ